MYSGAPSPWFDAAEKSSLNVRSKPGLGSTNLASSSLNKPAGKSKQLNRTWVGDWELFGQGRKIELEMDKRGEIVANSIDVNRLRNLVRFGNLVAERKSEKNLRWETKLSEG